MSESKYLVIPAEGDIDEDEGLTVDELVHVMAPAVAKDAARFRMLQRLAAPDCEDLMAEAAEVIAEEIEDQHGADLSDSEKLVLMMDKLIEKFGSE